MAISCQPWGCHFTCHIQWAVVSWAPWQICPEAQGSEVDLSPAHHLIPAVAVYPQPDSPDYHSCWTSLSRLQFYHSSLWSSVVLVFKQLFILSGMGCDIMILNSPVLPIESSKVIGLEPIEGSIIVTSKKDANNKNSSFSPVKFCIRKNRLNVWLNVCMIKHWRLNVILYICNNNSNIIMHDCKCDAVMFKNNSKLSQRRKTVVRLQATHSSGK